MAAVGKLLTEKQRKQTTKAFARIVHKKSFKIQLKISFLAQFLERKPQELTKQKV